MDKIGIRTDYTTFMYKKLVIKIKIRKNKNKITINQGEWHNGRKTLKRSTVTIKILINKPIISKINLINTGLFVLKKL